jgi:hypothetical protein
MWRCWYVMKSFAVAVCCDDAKGQPFISVRFGLGTWERRQLDRENAIGWFCQIWECGFIWVRISQRFRHCSSCDIWISIYPGISRLLSASHISSAEGGSRPPSKPNRQLEGGSWRPPRRTPLGPLNGRLGRGYFGVTCCPPPVSNLRNSLSYSRVQQGLRTFAHGSVLS